MVVMVFYNNCSKGSLCWVEDLHAESAAPTVLQMTMEQTGFGLWTDLL